MFAFQVDKELTNESGNETLLQVSIDSWTMMLKAIQNAIASIRLSQGQPSHRKRKNVREESSDWTKECEEAYQSREERAMQNRKTFFPDKEPSRSSWNRVNEADPVYRELDQRFKQVKKEAEENAASTTIGNLTKKEEWLYLRILRDIEHSSNPLTPPMIHPDGWIALTVDQKCTVLVQTLFPQAVSHDNQGHIPQTLPPHRTGLAPVTISELDAVVANMAVGKSAGPDEVRPELVKELYSNCRSFKVQLHKIIDACVQEGLFPIEWRKALISVIPKGGTRDLRQPKSYRPISLLCTTSKLVESIICHRLHHAIQQKRPFAQQYGGMPGILTSHAVGVVLDKGRTALFWERKKVALLTIDVAGAFNQIDHAKLKETLIERGLTAFSNWVAAWLHQRTFCLKMEQHVSVEYTMGRGIPQGSPLSPLLWACYLDTIFEAPFLDRTPSNFTEGAYVDDLFVVISSKNLENLRQDCQAWLDRIGRWCSSRGIGLDKPALLVAGLTQKERAEDFTLTALGDTRIQPTTSTVCLLGVDIGPRFSLDSFLYHKCDQTIRTANTLCWTMRSAGQVGPLVRLRIAKAILYPTLDFAGEFHPFLLRDQILRVGQAEKAIYLFVLGWRTGIFMPSGIALALELGQLSAIFRWRKQLLTFLGRTLSRPSHSSTQIAKEALGRVRQLANTEGMDIMDAVGAKFKRKKVSIGRKTSPFEIAAIRFPFDTIEEVTLPILSPNRWTALPITISQKEAAVATEKFIRLQKRNGAVRLYTDGSEGRTPPSLAAAFVAYTFGNDVQWQAQERLDQDHWAITEAELRAILLALESCQSGDTYAPGRQRPWKHIDVFSDSQAALQRLGSSWINDRAPMQHLTSQIRTVVTQLQARNTEVHLQWIPRHAQIPGNNAADCLAKQALLLPLEDRNDSGSRVLLKGMADAIVSTTQDKSLVYLSSDSLRAV